MSGGMDNGHDGPFGHSTRELNAVKPRCRTCHGSKQIVVYKNYRARSGSLEKTFDRYDPCPDCSRGSDING